MALMGLKPRAKPASYDEDLAIRTRIALRRRSDVSERKMFGGLCFLVGGNMACGIIKRELMVRVGPDGYEDALAQPHARPMDFTGTPLRGMVYVGTRGISTDPALAAWVDRAVRFAGSLPPK